MSIEGASRSFWGQDMDIVKEHINTKEKVVNFFFIYSYKVGSFTVKYIVSLSFILLLDSLVTDIDFWFIFWYF